MDIRKIDYEQLLSMSNDELQEAIKDGMRDIKYLMLGRTDSSGRTTRGLIDQIADKLYKYGYAPIPQSLRGYYDYDKVVPREELMSLKGLSGNDRARAIEYNRRVRQRNSEIDKINKPLVDEWVKLQKARFRKMDLEANMARASNKQSIMRHEVTILRDFLTNKTVSGRAWDKVVQGTLNTLEQNIRDVTGKSIKIPQRMYSKFWRVYQYVSEKYAQTNRGERYEVERRIAEVIIDNQYSNMTTEELGTLLNNRLDELTRQGEFEPSEEERVNEFDASGILFRR